MTQRDWQQPSAHVLGVFLNGQEIADRTPHGESIEDDSFVLLFNAWAEDIDFALPAARFGAAWMVALDTAEPSLGPAERFFGARRTVHVPSRSLQLLRRVT
ncbi:MAG TPA: hypothetical protein VGI54_12205, partial [Solirubrobacteraceae bacterium]